MIAKIFSSNFTLFAALFSSVTSLKNGISLGNFARSNVLVK